jgi:hypothetical protein
MKAALSALAAFALVCTAAIPPAAAQTPLFSSNDEIAVTIEGPISTIQGRMRGNTDAHPARLTVGEQTWDIELSARGQSRRTGGACTFPPLRVGFGEQRLRGTLFQGQKNIKLVTRCRPSDAYESYTVLEMLAYRLYNEITPQSFRIRPARVTYRDNREQEQFNFFLEDADDMARRSRLREIDLEPNEIRASALDPEAATRVALFQYMISNLDWDMVSADEGRSCCHNIVLTGAAATTRTGLVPVPYDFDHSGLVNTPYAYPREEFNQNEVRQRIYRGYCRFNDQLPAQIAHFRARRDALYAIIDGETRLSESRRRSARRFIEGFFETLDNPATLERMTARCR